MTSAFLATWLAATAPAAWFSGGPASLEGPRRLFEAGRFDQVIDALGESALPRLSHADQRQAYFYLGLAYERLSRPDKALGVFQLGAKLFPRDINLLTELAQLLHRSGLEEQAQPVFQRVLAIHPNNAASHLGLAEIDHSLGFLDRSAEHYEKALETMATEARVWSDYAEVLLAAREFSTAELAARRSLALRDDSGAAFNLARALRAQGKLDESLDILALALARFPSRPDLALARALWLLEAGRYEEALAAADQSILAASQPEPLALWIRARVNLKRDHFQKAVDDLRQAADADRRAPFVSAAAKELLRQLGAQR